MAAHDGGRPRQVLLYRYILNQVPVEATAVVISTIVKEMTGCEVDAQADPSTVSQFECELGILKWARL